MIPFRQRFETSSEFEVPDERQAIFDESKQRGNSDLQKNEKYAKRDQERALRSDFQLKYTL